MTPRTFRRTAGAVLFALASCNVYDSSLLVGGSGGGGGGGSGNTGGSGTTGPQGEDAGAGNGATAGTQGVTGTSGSGGVSGSSSGGTEASGGGPPTNGGEAGANDGGAGAGTSGTGGMSGTGGSAGGNGGTAGSSAGTGGTSGSGGSGGSGGGTSATGWAKLAVPLHASGDKAHFVITLNSTQDLTTGTISVRFYVQAGIGGSILPYVQDPNFAFFGKPAAELSTFSGWSVINWDVGAQTTTGNINKSTIKRVGIEITASPNNTWSNPTIVYLDSIPDKTTSFPFDATASVSTTAGSSDQSGQVLWFNNGSSDSTATGTLSWQATCP